MRAGLNYPDGETYTIHSPKNFFPTAATQMNFETLELNVIGQWSSNSRMNERYGRSVCANELLLRNAIIQKMASWWNMVESFRLPGTAPAPERIGEDPSAPQATAVDPGCSQVMLPFVTNTQDSTTLVPTPADEVVDETMPFVANTQDSTTLVPTPVDEVIDDTLNGSLPVEPSV